MCVSFSSSVNMFEVRGKRAIVTGAARGFGREFAIRLLSAGAKVCLSDVLLEDGRETAEELGERFGRENVAFVKCDVRDSSEWGQLWEAAEAHLGGAVTVLVNNAGVSPTKDWKMCLDVNFTGLANGAFLAIEKMDRRKGGEGGRIINVASYAGILIGLDDVYSSSYVASKFGVVGLTRNFGDYYAGLNRLMGIKCYALCPWWANTKLVRDEVDISQLERITHHRVLKVEEVGSALMTSLKADRNGRCYGIFPDAPLMEIPEPNLPVFGAFVLAAKVLRFLGLHDPDLSDSSGYVLRYRTVAVVDVVTVILGLVLIKMLASLIGTFLF